MGKTNEIHEIEVIYKRPVLSQMRSINCSNEIQVIFRELIPKDRIDLKEFFLVALISRNNHVLGVSKISDGTASQTVVNIKEILQLAIKTNACSVVVAHNHPSGNLQASDSDKSITRKIKEACQLLDVALLDHIILTSEGYYSFADDGII